MTNTSAARRPRPTRLVIFLCGLLTGTLGIGAVALVVIIQLEILRTQREISDKQSKLLDRIESIESDRTNSPPSYGGAYAPSGDLAPAPPADDYEPRSFPPSMAVPDPPELSQPMPPAP